MARSKPSPPRPGWIATGCTPRSASAVQVVDASGARQGESAAGLDRRPRPRVRGDRGALRGRLRCRGPGDVRLRVGASQFPAGLRCPGTSARNPLRKQLPADPDAELDESSDGWQEALAVADVSCRFSRTRPEVAASGGRTNRSSRTTAPPVTAEEATDELRVGRDLLAASAVLAFPGTGHTPSAWKPPCWAVPGPKMAAAAVGGMADGAVGDRVGGAQFAGGPLGRVGVPGAVRSVAGVRAWTAHTARDGRRASGRPGTIELCVTICSELHAGREAREALRDAATAACPDLAVRSLGRSGPGDDVVNVLRAAAGTPGREALAALAACWQVAEGGAGMTAAVGELADGLRAERAQRRELEAELAGIRTSARLLAMLPAVGLSSAPEWASRRSRCCCTPASARPVWSWGSSSCSAA